MKTSQLRITKYEQSAVVLETTSGRIAVDFGCYTTLLPNLGKTDTVLVSHVHPDHFNPDHVKQIGGSVFAAPEVVDRLGAVGVRATPVSPGEKFFIKDIGIQCVAVDHGPISSPIVNLGFLFEFDGAAVFFCGDMAIPSPPPVSRLDCVLVPVGDGKVFNPAQAAKYIRDIDHRRVVVPLHYHGKAAPESAEQFKTFVDGVADVRILDVGAQLEVGCGRE